MTRIRRDSVGAVQREKIRFSDRFSSYFGRRAHAQKVAERAQSADFCAHLGRKFKRCKKPVDNAPAASARIIAIADLQVKREDSGPLDNGLQDGRIEGQ